MQEHAPRTPDRLREVKITTGYTQMAAGSALIECGRTRVLCTASVVEGVPPFLRGKGQGWVTAEYAMLPGSTPQRKPRDGMKPDGRSVEIQRLIGRALRAACDMRALGERTIYIDCDVLQADGGTRTASVTGGYVALALAVDALLARHDIYRSPLTEQVAAVSVGIVDGTPVLDLEYSEDSRADVDMNLVMTRAGNFIELQGTGEHGTFSRAELDELLALGERGIRALMDAQRAALGPAARHICPPPRLVLATANEGKLRELRALLGARFDVVSMGELGLAPDIVEDGDTFEQNARIKAQALCALTGCAALSDDSGLEVDALGGRPGVHSARYAGTHGDDEANNRLLLRELDEAERAAAEAGEGAPARTARYVAALALCRPGGDPLIVRGTCEGEILREARGTGGFGYDPLFYSKEAGASFGEYPADLKNRISHRARALEALMERLAGEAQ